MSCERGGMRLHSIVLSILVVLVTLATIVADTSIDLAASAGSMPPSIVLLVCGLALVAVGAQIRKWLGRRQVPEP